jgi:hypothetical protein
VGTGSREENASKKLEPGFDSIKTDLYRAQIIAGPPRWVANSAMRPRRRPI